MRILTILLTLFFTGCATQKGTKGADAKAATEPVAAAKAAPAEGSQLVTCTKGKDSRTIARRPAATGGCEVAYTVAGNEKVIATAKKDRSYCDKVVEKVKTNLTTDKYSCQ